jgi:hypothetical protein
MGSRISFLGDVLARMLGLKDSTRMVSSSSLLLAIRARSAVIQMQSALYTSARSVSQARIAIDRVFTGASELELQVEEVRVRTDREVLVESGIDDNQHWDRLTKISRFVYHDTEQVFDKKRGIIQEFNKVACDAIAGDTSLDNTHVCLAWQRILAAFASEWICIRGGIDPEGAGCIIGWEFSRRCWIHQQIPYEIV